MNQINYTHTLERHHPKDALEILPLVFNWLKPKSVIDIGCANGSWLSAAKSLGVDTVLGVDGIQVTDKEMFLLKEEFVKHDLTQPFRTNNTFDLAICMEVAEHLLESSADTIIESLCAHSDVILFSAAIPNQGGDHHFNEQWPEYWHEKFKQKGYLAYDILRPKIWNNPNIFWWYKQNTIVYAKPNIEILKDLKPTLHINALVHPDLYNKKIFRPKYYNRTELWVLFKMVVKALIKSFK